MDKIHTKDAAEAILRELPSVLGAFVREDVNGHPREVHVLVGPGPEPRHLARDIRSLLEERLGVFVDQRVISIAQLSERVNQLPLEELEPEAPGTNAAARDPGAATPSSGAAVPDSTVTSPGMPMPPTSAPTADPHLSDTPLTGLSSAASSPTQQPARGPKAGRVIFDGVESETRQGRTEVRVRLSWRGDTYEGIGREIEGGLGRIRATAAATLRAATAACGERIRLELETASTVQALGREYVLVTALAVSPLVGRRPLALAGAHPLEAGEDTAAVLAALQASNRVLGLVLRD